MGAHVLSQSIPVYLPAAIGEVRLSRGQTGLRTLNGRQCNYFFARSHLVTQPPPRPKNSVGDIDGWVDR